MVGLVMMNVFRPGAGVTLPVADTQARRHGAQPAQARGTSCCTFPTSVVDAMAKGDILQIVVFATIFGVASRPSARRDDRSSSCSMPWRHVMFRFTGYVMRFAPIGVLAALRRRSAAAAWRSS